MKKWYLIPIFLLIPTSVYGFISSDPEIQCEQVDNSGIFAVCKLLGITIDNQEVIKHQNAQLIIQTAQSNKLQAYAICSDSSSTYISRVEGIFISSNWNKTITDCVNEILERTK